MLLMISVFLHRWHTFLGLRQQPHRCWHRARLREELRERRSARTCFARLSETSDVFFCISRAAHDGQPVCKRPPFLLGQNGLAYSYMVTKYTSRWYFYRVIALLCSATNVATIREVVNPCKDSKLDEVAKRHSLDRTRFVRIGRRMRSVWPFLS